MAVITDPPIKISGNPPDTDLGNVGTLSRGPFVFGSSLYLILVTGANQTLQCYKSINNGTTWTLEATGPDTAQENLFITADSGANIEIVYSRFGPNEMTYVSFTPGIGFSTPVISTAGHVNFKACRFSDGDILAIYQRTGGGLDYERLSGVTWTVPTTLFTAPIFTAVIKTLAGDSNKTGHFTYSLSGLSKYRNVTIGNNVAAEGIIPGVGNWMEIWNNRILVSAGGSNPVTFEGTPIATPSWVTKTIATAGAVAYAMILLVDSTHVVFWYVHFSVLYYVTYDGTIFGTPVDYYEATNLPPPGGFPTGDAEIDTILVGLIPSGTSGYGIAAKLLYDDPNFLRSTFYLRNTAPSPVITCGSPPQGRVGTSYTTTFTATSGTPGYTYSISGMVPPGLLLNTSTGVLSGTPTAAGVFSFLITVTDSASATASVTCSITILAAVIPPGTLTLACDTPPAPLIGVAYDHPLLVSGGTLPYTWSQDSGTLPLGILFTNGHLVGTPSQTGSFVFTLRVTDSLGATAAVTCSFSIAPGSGGEVVCPVVTRDTPPTFSGLQIPINTEIYLRNAMNDEGTISATTPYIKQVDIFMINGVMPSVRINQTPTTNLPVFVFIAGVLQRSPSDYLVSGSTYTFTGTFSSAPVRIVYWM